MGAVGMLGRAGKQSRFAACHAGERELKAGNERARAQVGAKWHVALHALR